MLRLHVASVLVLVVFPGRSLVAQSGDSIYAGRQCNNRLKALRMPELSDLGDSARFDSLLTAGADARAHMTSVSLRFQRDGALNEVSIGGARSSAAAAQIKSAIRPLLTLTQVPVGEFQLELVRLNATGQLRLLAGNATCAPEQHKTALLSVQLARIQQQFPQGRFPRDAIVTFILEPDGQVSNAWLSLSSGSSQADSMALELFRSLSFEAAIVGTTPVATLVRQPFRF